VQDTHPWRFFRDVAKPFEVEARHKRSGFGMTCLQYSTGWANAVFIKVQRCALLHLSIHPLLTHSFTHPFTHSHHLVPTRSFIQPSIHQSILCTV
jgi:hypothetical protein